MALNTPPSVPVASQTAARNTNLPDQAVGFLTWWTIHQHLYHVKALTESAKKHDLPQAIQRYLRGSDLHPAWQKATQLGATGHPSHTGDPQLKAKYLVRELGDQVRAVVREVVDLSGKRVEFVQAARLGREHDSITVEVEPHAYRQYYYPEMVAMLEAMQADMEDRVGKVDDGRIRVAVLEWLAQMHRVCVRGTGGVYYVPTPALRQDEVRKQILSVREWIAECTLGSFSVIQITQDGVSSIGDIQSAAVEEILKEIAEVEAKLEFYESNAKMNAGTIDWTTDNQLDKLNTVRRKIETLEETLGDIVLNVQVQFDLTKKRAVQLKQSAAAGLQSAQPLRNQPPQPGKKSGTAQERQHKVKL